MRITNFLESNESNRVMSVEESSTITPFGESADSSSK